MPDDKNLELKGLIEKQNATLEEIEKTVKGKAESVKVEAVEKSLESISDFIAQNEMDGDETIAARMKSMRKSIDDVELIIEDVKKKQGIKGVSYEEKLHSLVTNEEFKSALKKREKKDFGFDIKSALASSTAFTSDSGTTDLLQMNIPGVTKSPWMQTPAWAAVAKSVVGEKVGSIRYTEEVSKTNSAAFKAEGVALPQSEVGWIARTENFYKLGHYTTFPEEMVEDADYTMGEIDDLLRNGLMREVENAIFLGDGSTADEIFGWINTTSQLAKNFAKPWNLDDAITNPNHWDVIMSAMLQASNGVDTDGSGDQEGYMANICFINPGTSTYLKTIKAEGRPIWKEYMTSDDMFSNLRIIPSRDIPAGKFLVCDGSKSRAYIKRNLTIKTSENVASQFLADQVSIKATMRLAHVVKVLERYAFVYGDFETAVGLIAAS
jgi:hypothetical protein